RVDEFLHAVLLQDRGADTTRVHKTGLIPPDGLAPDYSPRMSHPWRGRVPAGTDGSAAGRRRRRPTARRSESTSSCPAMVASNSPSRRKRRRFAALNRAAG